MSPKRRQLLTFFAGLLAFASFLFLSSIAVVWANGLRFNPETKRFEQTAVIAVEGEDDYTGVGIFVNGEKVGSEVPFQQRNLLPGYYEILIQKDGYQPWRQVFDLAPGEVGLIDQYILIAEQPLSTVPETPPSFTEPLIEAGLSLSEDGELLDRNKLVSRFVGQPVLARRLNHGYLYQIANELRLHFPDGPQDFLIYQLPSAEPALIVVRQSNWELIIKDGETAKRLQLTVPETSTSAR